VITIDNKVSEKMGHIDPLGKKLPVNERGSLVFNQKVKKIRVKATDAFVFCIELHGAQGLICKTRDENNGSWTEYDLEEGQ